MPLTKVLGPGNRFAIWVQGCPFHCKGCLAPDSLNIDSGYLFSISVLAEEILSQQSIEGITISGGEPFEQAASLVQLIDLVKQEKNLGIIVYSGYDYEKLMRKAKSEIEVSHLLEKIDLLIDGLYIETKNDGFSMKGSSNQRFICLTDRYKEFVDALIMNPHRAVEFHVGLDDITLVGVPSKQQIDQWNMLKKSGSEQCQ